MQFKNASYFALTTPLPKVQQPPKDYLFHYISLWKQKEKEKEKGKGKLLEELFSMCVLLPWKKLTELADA